MNHSIKYIISCSIAFIVMQSLHGQTYDLVIHNGRILNGTGNHWIRADIGIVHDKIKYIGVIDESEGVKNIDAEDHIVSPGFIDVHAHVEGSLLIRPTADNFVLDGVTSIITGNCGGSSLDMQTYFEKVEAEKTSLNVASLVGHNTVRRAVMNNEDREPTAEELETMKGLVGKAMKAGAVGLSTGLIYLPGNFAKTDEIVELAKVAKAHGGVYASHIRHEDERIVGAIEEAATIGKEANIPVEVSHFKISGKNNWGFSKETVRMIEQYRREGLDITVDQYPYTASSTRLGVLLPEWAREGEVADLQQRLADPDIRKRIISDMKKSLKASGFKNYSYSYVAFCPWDESLNGKNITQIAELKHGKAGVKREIETILEMMNHGVRVQMVYHKMNEEDVHRIMQYPFTMIASDAGIPALDIGSPHPRAYGTNARVLGKYVREDKVIPLSEAIRKMTSLPALKFNLLDRGLLLPGYAADIVIFDEAQVGDRATFERPHQYAVGIHTVVVNGQIVVEKGKHTGSRPGQLLKGLGATSP